MEQISSDEILRKHGTWVRSSKFAEIVADKKRVSIRQARNIIKKDSGRIIKHVFSDRTAIYGLPEFGPPTPEVVKEKNLSKSNFYRSLVQQFWKERENAMRSRSNMAVVTAWDKTQRFAEILPDSAQKPKLAEDIKAINEKSRLKIETGFVILGDDDPRFRGLNPREKILFEAIPEVWKKIAAIIQEF